MRRPGKEKGNAARAQHLVQQTEGDLLPTGIRSLFALTGAYSFGMNLPLPRNGYHFGGTLTKENCSSVRWKA